MNTGLQVLHDDLGRRSNSPHIQMLFQFASLSTLFSTPNAKPLFVIYHHVCGNVLFFSVGVRRKCSISCNSVFMNNEKSKVDEDNSMFNKK